MAQHASACGIPRVDAHQHYWQLARGDYHWLAQGGPALAALQRDFGPDDLQPLLQASGVQGTVLVQATNTEAETDTLLAWADAHDSILGVVGWADLSLADTAATLARWAGRPKFKGVRPMLQDLPDPDWLDHGPHPAALQALIHHGLRMDALVRTEHLPALGRFVTRWPQLPVVIDHAAKPPVAEGYDSPSMRRWRAGMGRLAEHPQVVCKLSGLLTELIAVKDTLAGAPSSQARHILQPVVGFLLKHFGSHRLMWGSDWPVVTLAASYADWVHLSHDCLLAAGGDATSTPEAPSAIWHDTARRFYGLPAPIDAQDASP